MKIIPIFEPYLYSFQYDTEFDAFTTLMQFWTNAIELDLFFEKKSGLLDFFEISKKQAIQQTIKEAEILYDTISTNKGNLNILFRPLIDLEIRQKLLSKHKIKRYWLRVYAIKLQSGYYVITGGAIKQSQAMKDDPHTKKELVQLVKCSDYLIKQGVMDIDGFKELMI